MTHDLCYLLLFIIEFNHTNSGIRSSGHSRGPFASASDYACMQWSAGSSVPDMEVIVAEVIDP